jgi:hypothetical protein
MPLLPLALLLFAILGPRAWASSRFWFGTILDDAAAGKDGTVTMNTLNLVYGYGPEAGHRLRSVALPSDVPVYLDWKRSTLADAIKSGRTFVFFTNHKHIADPQGNPMAGPYTGSRGGGALLVSTAPSPVHRAVLNAPECNLLIASLDKPGNLASLCSAPPEKGAGDARLVLAIENGRTASAFVWTPQLPGGAWHETDVAGLKFDKGTLDGVVTVKFSVANGKTATGAYTLKTDAQGAGTFTGALETEKTVGKVTVIGLSATAPGDEVRLWLHTKDPRFRSVAGDSGWHYLVCDFAGGKSGSGWLCHEKGFATGRLADPALALADAKIAGTFEAAGLKDGKGLKVSVNGRVQGGHFVAVTLTFGEKNEALPAVGFLMHPGVAPLVQPGSEKGAH